VRDLQAAAQSQFQQEAQTLQQRLTDTQQKLRDVEQGGSTNGKPTNATSLTREQQAAIDRVKRELVETRTELRDVQHKLRRDIDSLGDVLAFINIALVPLILTLVALVRASFRRRKHTLAKALGTAAHA